MTGEGGAVVAEIAGGLPGVSLAEVVATGELMTRTDRKYLLRPGEFLRLLDALGRPRALDIDGRRSFGYSSTYFDSPDLTVYRAHRQDRRRRFKIRTRTYTDSADSYCEVKVSGRREETVKVRRPHPADSADVLGPAALTFARDRLAAFGHRLPGPLTATLVSDYRRTTVVTADGSTRVTCDTGLVWSAGDRTCAADDGLVLLEVKSATDRNPVTEAASRLRIREASVSKYCAGLVALGAVAGGNRWFPALRRLGTGPAHRR